MRQLYFTQNVASSDPDLLPVDLYTHHDKRSMERDEQQLDIDTLFAGMARDGDVLTLQTEQPWTKFSPLALLERFVGN